jgi:Zn-finger protein
MVQSKYHILYFFSKSHTGEYQDRRHLTTVDCSDAIWILSTNAMDSTIKDFCSKHRETVFLDDQSVHLMKQLSQEIKEDFLSQFDVSKTI